MLNVETDAQHRVGIGDPLKHRSDALVGSDAVNRPARPCYAGTQGITALIVPTDDYFYPDWQPETFSDLVAHNPSKRASRLTGRQLASVDVGELN